MFILVTSRILSCNRSMYTDLLYKNLLSKNIIKMWYFNINKVFSGSIAKRGLAWWLSDKEPVYKCRRCGFSLGWEDLLEKEMTTHFSILAWVIFWMEEPNRLQSLGSQKSHLATKQKQNVLYEIRTNMHCLNCGLAWCFIISSLLWCYLHFLITYLFLNL